MTRKMYIVTAHYLTEGDMDPLAEKMGFMKLLPGSQEENGTLYTLAYIRVKEREP